MRTCPIVIEVATVETFPPRLAALGHPYGIPPLRADQDESGKVHEGRLLGFDGQGNALISLGVRGSVAVVPVERLGNPKIKDKPDARRRETLRYFVMDDDEAADAFLDYLADSGFTVDLYLRQDYPY